MAGESFKELSIYEGMTGFSREFKERMIAPSCNDYVLLHAINENKDAPKNFENCRFISADTAGIVRIRYRSDEEDAVHDEVCYLPAGIWIGYRNVIRLYHHYTGSTPGTARCYGADGVDLTNAIKLRR